MHCDEAALKLLLEAARQTQPPTAVSGAISLGWAGGNVNLGDIRGTKGYPFICDKIFNCSPRNRDDDHWVSFSHDEEWLSIRAHCSFAYQHPP